MSTHTSLPRLSSGKKLEWQGGRPIYSAAQLHLVCALVELDPHPLDRDGKHLMARTIEALDLAPEEVLTAVADHINELRMQRSLKVRPRLSELQNMSAAAMNINAALYQLLKR